MKLLKQIYSTIKLLQKICFTINHLKKNYDIKFLDIRTTATFVCATKFRVLLLLCYSHWRLYLDLMFIRFHNLIFVYWAINTILYVTREICNLNHIYLNIFLFTDLTTQIYRTGQGVSYNIGIYWWLVFSSTQHI